jgi:adenine-specific DNA-methyltransferase
MYKKKYIKSPFRYFGSKLRELDKIIPHIPKQEYKNIIDLFGGSGVVLINLLDRFKAENYIYNEKCKHVYGLMNTIKNKDELEKFKHFLNNVDIDIAKTKFKDLLNNIKNDVYKYAYMCFYSYLGASSTPNLTNGKTTLKRRNIKTLYDLYHDNLQKIKLENKDFRKILNEIDDDENTFIYLDPPYCSKSQKWRYNNEGYKDYKDFNQEDFIYLMDFLKKTKCKVLLNCDFSGYIYMNYKDYIKEIYPKNYFGRKDKINVQRYQCILTNY